MRVGVQAPLGFAAGIPLYLSSLTLSKWLADRGVDIESVGLFALVALPYNFKFVWAPLFDRYAPPWLDARRGWMLVFAPLTALAIAAMATLDPASDTGALAVAALCVATLSASLDVVVDAYRAEVLEAGERGRGASTYVIGYRLGLIVSGFGALSLADHLGWQSTYAALAGLALVSAGAVLAAPPPRAHRPPTSLGAAIVEPLRELFARRGALAVLAFVLLFKIGESFALQLLLPFLGAAGYDNAEIGLVQNAVGLTATIAGVGLGGPLVDRLGLIRSLLIFGALQSLGNLGYLAIAAAASPGSAALVVAVVIDNVCNGLGTAALVAFFMALCHRRYSATQYALLTSASTVLGRFVSASSGYLQAAVGWAGLFLASVLAALPALAILIAWRAAIAECVEAPRPEKATPRAE